MLLFANDLIINIFYALQMNVFHSYPPPPPPMSSHETVVNFWKDFDDSLNIKFSAISLSILDNVNYVWIWIVTVFVLNNIFFIEGNKNFVISIRLNHFCKFLP